ncbi:pollen-specific leucine-rich repeat extensin-like protein 2 [Punica granatum]|uniref:Pollen-specific leucine-rich repeat extensin-like protein 2 n=1 Tax=Punica granatum TaxID=22663 RepID=A0A6P8EK12_PUNGR|nr:pollen-specific leucine-rich repeat extensin-like protein 2 [Punica granatum]
MAEEDRVDISEEVNPPAPTLSQPPLTHAPPPPTPAGILPAYSGTPPANLPPLTSLGALHAQTSQTPSASEDQARIAALEGTVNQLATSMAANMAELFALLKGSNRTSLSSTPPPGPGPTADPTPWAPPTQAPENIEAPAPPTLHTSTIHPFTSQFPPPPAPTAVPLPPATFLSSEHVLSAPPPFPYRPQLWPTQYLRRWFSRRPVHLLRLIFKPRSFLPICLYSLTPAFPTRHRPL